MTDQTKKGSSLTSMPPASIKDDPSKDAPTVKKSAESFDLVDLKEFRDSGMLWAVNRFLLWPLNLSLSVDTREGEPPTLSVREWRNTTDEKMEVIELREDEDLERYRVFQSWLLHRLAGMKRDDRMKSLNNLLQRGYIHAVEQLILVDE